MTAVIPARFLFRWSWPVKRHDHLPCASGRLLDLPPDYRCCSLSVIDGATEFAESRMAWNSRGLGLSIAVHGKREPLRCFPLTPTVSDHVTIWLDTRSTQTVHRATKFCHQFCFIPAGAGPKKDRPSVSTYPMVRGQDERLAASAKGTAQPVQVWSEVRDDGYVLEAWLPTEALTGFDPDTHRQLGFYLLVKDQELGEQYLTVSREFPFEHDPSLWQLLELCD